MNLFLRKILLICCCFFVWTYTNGQVKLYASVSPQAIGRDDYFLYKITIENSDNLQSVTAPPLANFNVIAPPSHIVGYNTTNGSVTKYITVAYTLKPKRTGKFLINGALVNIGGKQFKSNSVAVTVSKTAPAYSGLPNLGTTSDPTMHQRTLSDFKDYIFHKGDSLADKVNKNMEFRVEVDKPTCYVGEPIVASYKLYTRLKSESRLRQSSSFAGFSVVYMPQQDPNDESSNLSKGKLNGKECNVLLIRKAQLYSLQPGITNLESAALETNVQFIKEEYARQMAAAGRIFDDFPGFLFPPDAVVNQSVVLETKPINITVKPLPEKDKPAGFNGAVGSFNLDASLQKPLFSTDESGKLSVTISGSGNMQLLTAPEIHWPKGIESFEPKVTDNLVNETVPISGSKVYEYSFAANDSGHYMLPSVSFSYFDPVAVMYKTITTAPIEFQVTKGDGHTTDLSKFNIEKDKPAFINRIFYHRWWIIVFIAAVMLTVLICWIIRDRRMTARTKMAPVIQVHEKETIDRMIETTAVNQKNVFSETEKCLYTDDCFSFYALLNNELKNYLGIKLSAEPNSINSNSILVEMDKKGIPNEVVLNLQNLMQDIEWQLYTPFERNEKMHELYRRHMKLCN